LACNVPTAALTARSQRRFERLLDNPRLRPRLAQRQLARAVLRPWTGQTLLLLLDETPKANDLRVLNVRVGYDHRTLPLAAVCYRPDALPKPMPELVLDLLGQVRTCLPEGAST